MEIQVKRAGKGSATDIIATLSLLEGVKRVRIE
jgi:hypothetical protein